MKIRIIEHKTQEKTWWSVEEQWDFLSLWESRSILNHETFEDIPTLDYHINLHIDAYASVKNSINETLLYKLILINSIIYSIDYLLFWCVM